MAVRRVLLSAPRSIIALFAATRPEIRHCRAEVSDGEDGGAGIVGFSSPDPEAILSRTRSSSRRAEQAALRKIIMDTPSRNWAEARRHRSSGADSSERVGLVVADDMERGKHRIDSADPHVPLVARCRRCRCQAGRPGGGRRSRRQLAAGCFSPGVLGPRLRPSEWRPQVCHRYRRQPPTAGPTFFTRLLMGCCVIKVASPFGYRQWYYGDLVPWRHYVPVAADMKRPRREDRLVPLATSLPPMRRGRIRRGAAKGARRQRIMTFGAREGATTAHADQSPPTRRPLPPAGS